MANTSRRILNKEKDKQFMPMNMSGQDDKSGINNIKLITIVIIALMYVFTFAKMSGHTLVIKIAMFTVVTFFAQLALRYIIFEEKFYYKMYKEMKGKEVVTTDEFWDIPDIKRVKNGAVLIYSNTTVGVLIKMERDVITGKADDFSEKHFDALSDMLKELTEKKFSIVHMNLMEPNDKDERFKNLDRIKSSDNPNLNKLNTLIINNIKNIASNTLNDNDYYLVYTKGTKRYEEFISEVESAIDKATEGGYVGYKILGYDEMKDINEFAKLNFNIEYFNLNEAELNVYGGQNMVARYIRLKAVEFKNGEIREINKEEESKLMKEASEAIDKDNYKLKNSVKETLSAYENKNYFGVDLEEINKIYNS